jgi:DNA-binding response OmpR family regulator
MIKFDLLTTLDEQERYELEKCLLTDLSDEKSTPSHMTPDTQKALRVINYIRQQAASVTGQMTKPYQVGLLYATIDNLTTYKPEIHYTRRELMSYLHSLLSIGMLCQTLNPDNDTVRFLIDYDNKVVKIGERVEKLTRLQFELLVYLEKNQARICSRDELLHHLFQEEEFEREDSALDAHISRLRKRIEPDPNNPRYIITIPGYGYKFIKYLTPGPLPNSKKNSSALAQDKGDEDVIKLQVICFQKAKQSKDKYGNL